MKPYVFNNGNDIIFKLEVKPNCHNDPFLHRKFFLMRNRILHNQNKPALEKKEITHCHYVTKKSSVPRYELILARKCHSHNIKTD